MDFKKLKNLIEKDVRLKLESSTGLSLFSNNSEKFENWLKIELAGALAKEEGTRKRIIPEALVNAGENQYEVDLLLENEWAIELKVLNSLKNNMPSSETVESIKNDISKLKEIKNGYTKRSITMHTAVAYFVLPDDNENTAYVPENILSEVFGSDNVTFVNDRKTFFLNDNSKKGSIYVREV